MIQVNLILPRMKTLKVWQAHSGVWCVNVQIGRVDMKMNGYEESQVHKWVMYNAP